MSGLRRPLLLVAVAFCLAGAALGGGAGTAPTLDPVRGPVFISEPPSRVAFANTVGTAIPCTAYGVPAPALEWVIEDGTPVDNQAGLLLILPNNTLQFPPFLSSSYNPAIHSRTYRCVATNTAGTVISRNVSVRAVVTDQYKNYNVQLNDKWVMRGATAVMHCVINPYYVKDYVKVIGWTQGTKVLNSGDRVSILPGGELHIRDVRDSDGMKYTCRTRNVLTGDERSSAQANLRVHDPPALATAPNIDGFVQSVTLQQGETSELPCVSSQAYPAPTYTWSKNGKNISMEGGRYQQLGGNLVIVQADISDSGYYVCTAANEQGSSAETVQVTVTSALSVSVEPSEQTVDAGRRAIFNCSVFGYPVASVRWFRDGRPLLEDGRVSVQSRVLYVDDVQRQDEGMYQCFAYNDEDSAQGSAQLSLGAAQPVILEAFQELFVQAGQKISLRCKASGNPTPQVTWLLDGSDVPRSDRIRTNTLTTTEGDVISYVNISQVRVEDGGEYTCHSVNDVGEAMHVGRLNVYGIPYIRPLANITATANEKLSIRCYVSGFPIYSITWSRDKYDLPITHLQKVQNGTLIIEKVQKNYDEGKYTCTARNRQEQGMSRDVYVSVVEPPAIDPFTFPQKKQGDRIVVSCVISSGDLPIDIEWRKDGRPIPLDLGIYVQKTGPYSSLLSIGDASPRHDGNYTCLASNVAASTSYTSPLRVDVPPRWVVEPSHSFVELHKSVRLDCQTAGTPTPIITWKKATGNTPGNYVDLVFSPDNPHMRLLRNGTLLILDAQETDHGYYLCHAHNGIGVGLSKLVLLTVHIPARFDEPEKNYTVLRGHNVTMECQAIGDKPLSISWSFNNAPVSPESHSRATMTLHNTPRGRLSKLFLAPAVRTDSGFYVCNAKNQFGYGSLTLRLLVLESPEAPSSPEILNTSSRSVTLTWKAPFNGNSALLYYIVQYKKANEAWHGETGNQTLEASHTTAVLEGLHPAFTYHIRVLANNSIGYSPPSAVLNASTMEEAPTGPPEQVEVKAVGSQALKITWKPPQEVLRNGDILGYYIGYRETHSPTHFVYVTKRVEGNFTGSYVLDNLRKFTEYTIQVKAFNRKGTGPASPDITVFTLEDVPSQPPQAVQATAVSSRSVRVVWSPPPLYTLHGILQGYKVLFKPVRKDEDESDANLETTARLEATLQELKRFTNYSVQVLAYTRKGEGVRSEPIYVTTQQDVPEKPSAVKALAVNGSTLLVVWQPPAQPNGLLTQYALYLANVTARPGEGEEEKHVLPPNATSHVIENLRSGQQYGVRVTASTVMGEGESSGIYPATPQEQVPARIASFPTTMTVPWHQTLVLPCVTVGIPAPVVSWSLRNQPVTLGDRMRQREDGSLQIDSLLGSDAANYTCTAENNLGKETLSYVINVQVGDSSGSPPNPPRLSLALTTTSSVQVNWLSGSNGGSPILGFVLNYKKDHGAWMTVRLGPQNRTFIATNLQCGTPFKFTIYAFSRFGDSDKSNIVSARTNGSAPIMPPQSKLLKSTNVTSVDLDLSTWQTSGCPIRFYSVKYREWRSTNWVLVSNNIKSNVTVFTVTDLHPATWYVMIVTAHSDTGSSDSELRFATLTYTGSTIVPILVKRKEEAEFYEKIYVMVPLCGAVIVLMVIAVGLFLYCRRRRERLRYKEHVSNLRRDITAETSLMNDLDKRLNVDLDSSSSSPGEHFGKRNVNLLISLHSDDNLHGNSQAWLIHDSSKTTSDNGSICRSEDEGNINPYATFNELKGSSLHEGKLELKRELKSSDEDDIALQKAQAQREFMMATPSEPYVPFFHTKERRSRSRRQHPPPLPAARQPPPPQGATADPPPKEGYDNHGVILSPRKYASADQIHALFASPPRPPSAYKSGSGSSDKGASGSSDKGSQRHSLISSVTTVSSSRDELLEALENARRNPPPPVVYESQGDSQDSSSQPTDSSATEPGIRQFTQSPPKPNEQRLASCEVPAYEHKRTRRPARIEMESDTTECEGGEPLQKSPPRRCKGRHRGKQKGHPVTKRPVGPSNVPRAHSRTSTTSTNSEEVTYTFAGGSRDSPQHGGRESYRPFRGASAYGYSEPDSASRRGQGARGTPHGRHKYEVETPGADESKPLVLALAKPGLASPREEDETVSLLDRHYRAVPEDEAKGQGGDDGDNEKDKDYTDDFTIV